MDYCILNVAEKPSVAKEIARHLGRQDVKQERSYSKYNPVTTFKGLFNQRNCRMFVTSVRGHLMELEFSKEYQNWTGINPSLLFTAPVLKSIKQDCTDVSQNLKNYSLKASVLVLWLDCDREGENIAFEVIEVCRVVNPNLQILRAHFSALTKSDIDRAWRSLTTPNSFIADAVDCRQELDLRMGAALTRFLTLRYRPLLNSKVISFGPCQFPTLGFVVERYLMHEKFQSEPFWTLKLRVEGHGTSVDFHWKRGNVFDKYVVLLFKSICLRAESASVVSVIGKPITKRKPLPLTTTQMAILVSRQLKISSKQCMQIAESLYQKGFISYPRTETDSFSDTMDLKGLITIQQRNSVWGHYAKRLNEGGQYKHPHHGKNNDQAHPPIHPVKSCVRNDLQNENEWKIYDFITRHFLACCSDDAYGSQTNAEIELNGELFYANGLIIKEKNYLEIYPFDHWTGKQLPPLSTTDILTPPPPVILTEGKTTPPPLLIEADLIKKMDQNGIGTDATMHEHIQTIQDRDYVEVKKPSGQFIPTPLGLSLVKGFRSYTEDFLDLSKPRLRAEVELNLLKIATGEKTKTEVLCSSIEEMSRIFAILTTSPDKLDQSIIGTSALMSQPLGGRNPAMIPEIERLTHVVVSSLSACRCGQFMKVCCCSTTPLHQRGRGGRGVRQMIQTEQQQKYLVCQNQCQGPLPLPRRGVFEPHQFVCPACNYQVLKVTNPETHTTHYLCPYCFTYAPSTQYNNKSNDIENIPSQLRCFLCCHSTCRLANRTQ